MQMKQSIENSFILRQYDFFFQFHVISFSRDVERWHFTVKFSVALALVKILSTNMLTWLRCTVKTIIARLEVNLIESCRTLLIRNFYNNINSPMKRNRLLLFKTDLST